MSRQVSRSLSAFASGVLLAALVAGVPASAAGRSDSSKPAKADATSTATLMSPNFTDPLGRKVK
jgi:hypothetical protein